jgi:hypothetical protein
MIRHETLTLAVNSACAPQSLGEFVESRLGARALRWYISRAKEGLVCVESAMLDSATDRPLAMCASSTTTATAALHIVPTGVGCEIGGYAGDAAPATRLLSSTVDYLLTNPNAVNASNFLNLSPNTIYVDGLGLDLFMKGQSHLHIPVQNRIGVILDACPRDVVDRCYNIVNAIRAVHGVDIAGICITDEPIGGRCVRNAAGAYTGTVDNIPALYRACDRLLGRGATAIAIASIVKDLPHLQYAEHFAGLEPNPVGGVEAIISYVVRKRYRIPVAHAPLINDHNLGIPPTVVDARAAGEVASWSGLACILVGLNRSPQLCGTQVSCTNVISKSNLLAVVVPDGCIGGVPSLFAYSNGTTVVAVRQNQSILKVSKQDLRMHAVVEANSYAETAGFLLALRNGLSIASVTRPIETLRPD